MWTRSAKVAAVGVIGLIAAVGCKPEEKKTPATAAASTPPATAVNGSPKPATQPTTGGGPTTMPAVGPTSILPPLPKFTPGSLPASIPVMPPLTPGSTTRPAFPTVPDLNK